MALEDIRLKSMRRICTDRSGRLTSPSDILDYAEEIRDIKKRNKTVKMIKQIHPLRGKLVTIGLTIGLRNHEF